MKDLALYIHIPFCRSKCYYCDFISFPKKDNRIEEYVDYLIKEIGLYKNYMEDYKIKTIFIGGGSPSHIEGRHIYKILEYIQGEFNCQDLQELSIEANPESLDRDKLAIYRAGGINRISIGLQSFKDELLENIGRCHNSSDFYRAYELVRSMGFKNVNLDLMFGLPYQSLEDCQDSLEKAVNLDVEHISYYSLILEENTLMDKYYQEGRIEMPSEDLERDMYHQGIELLKSKGYDHYEVSNFSKKGFQCKHNLFYWQLRPYLGFGISSHSNMDSRRFWNYNNFKAYYEKLDKEVLPIENEEYIDKDLEMAEYMIMGLRLVEGISRREFYNRFHIDLEEIYGDVLKKHKSQSLLDLRGDKVSFTAKGMDLSNIVYVDLLPE